MSPIDEMRKRAAAYAQQAETLKGTAQRAEETWEAAAVSMSYSLLLIEWHLAQLAESKGK